LSWLENLFCSEYKSKIDKLEKKNKELRKRVEKLKEKNEELKEEKEKQKHRLKNKIQDLMDKVRKLTNTRERLQKELQNKRQKIKSLKSEIKDLNKKIDKRDSRIQSLKSKIDDLKGYKSKYERWIEGKLEIETEKKNAPWLKEQIHNEYPDAKIKPYDFSAQVTSEEEAKRIVKEDLTDTMDYVRSEWDCENFSFLFASLCRLKYGVSIGIVLDIDAKHAYNLWVYKDGKVETFEPQNDKFGVSGDHYSPNTKSRIVFF